MSEPASPTALLVADLFEAVGAIRRHGDRLAGAVGHSQARWQVLSVLSAGDWTTPRVARRLGVTRQSVQRIVDLLAEEGMLTLEPNPEHARSPLLRLTEHGRALLAQTTAAARAWHDEVERAIPKRDLQAARATVRRLTELARDGAQDDGSE